ncbi:MAG: MoxR family ATPase [Myxococcales bacterium]|nr:MoxR family ATPase [Myxococcales bacterium]
MSASRGDDVVPDSVDGVLELLASGDYICDRQLATVVFLALTHQRPLFLEGEPGVGKTEIAKVLAATLSRRLVRLQCYEGLDTASAVYEWNVAQQLLEIRLADQQQGRLSAADLYDRRFLIERPLLQALRTDPEGAPVLLIDELDRADEPFEAFLLEVLSEYQITIPELGAIAAEQPPIVIVTSNRTREVHDALKRRCLYHWVDYPSADTELQILRTKVPDAEERFAAQIVAYVHGLREQNLFKSPGVAESIEWTQAMLSLDQVALDPDTVDQTLGVLLKYQDDIKKVRGDASRALIDEVAGKVGS